MSTKQAFLFLNIFTYLSGNLIEMAKKPTNKDKFSLYLDKTLMSKIKKLGEKVDRSTNYMVEKALEEKYL